MHGIEIGIRALKQNASRVVADVVAGEEVVITDRGRPVARLTPLVVSRLQYLIEAGLARPARRDITELPAPEPGGDLSGTLQRMRDDERD